MGSSSSFRELFAKSQFANYHPDKIYKSIAKISDKWQTFGLKHDIPTRNFKKEINYIKLVSGLEGSYRSYIPVQDANDIALSQEIIKEIKSRNPLSRIPARVLNKINGYKDSRGNYYRGGGYAMGLGGIVAFLPSTEIPNAFSFSKDDILNRKAYWCWIKRAEMCRDKPEIILTFKQPISLI